MILPTLIPCRICEAAPGDPCMNVQEKVTDGVRFAPHDTRVADAARVYELIGASFVAGTWRDAINRAAEPVIDPRDVTCIADTGRIDRERALLESVVAGAAGAQDGNPRWAPPPLSAYRCTDCDAEMSRYEDFEEYQHRDCGGLVILVEPYASNPIYRNVTAPRRKPAPASIPDRDLDPG